MKLILAGTTGFIGSEILIQSIANPSITSIAVLSRRPLPNAPQSSKLKVHIIEDFTTYFPSLLAELHGAEACIWTLGIVPAKATPGLTVDLDFTLAAATAFATTLAPAVERFRFVYASGMLAERDQEKKLWFMEAGRRLRGMVETRLHELAQGTKPAKFETIIVRPAAVLAKETMMPRVLASLSRSVRVDELAAVMVEAAVKGCEVSTLEMGVLSGRGRKLLGL